MVDSTRYTPRVYINNNFITPNKDKLVIPIEATPISTTKVHNYLESINTI